MNLDDILETFSNDMIKNGKTTEEALKKMTRLDLALKLLDTYVKYPLPSKNTAIFPYNYCAIPRLLSGTSAQVATQLLKFFCEKPIDDYVADL